MRRNNPDAVFRSINETARLTGLSTAFIRSGVKAGTVPHIRVGVDYRVNVPLFLQQLDEKSRGACWDGI